MVLGVPCACVFAPLLRSLPAPLCITFKYVFVAHACEYYVLLSCMQATAEAITLGECMHSEAISDVRWRGHSHGGAARGSGEGGPGCKHHDGETGSCKGVAGLVHTRSFEILW